HSHTPSGKRSAALAAARSASRVFPIPPMPHSVTSRWVRRRRRMASRSPSRPTNLLSSRGRFCCACAVFAAMDSGGSDGRERGVLPGESTRRGEQRKTWSEEHHVLFSSCLRPAQPERMFVLFERVVSEMRQSGHRGQEDAAGDRVGPSAAASRAGSSARVEVPSLAKTLAKCSATVVWLLTRP